jgi:hypothetical protein
MTFAKPLRLIGIAGLALISGACNTTNVQGCSELARTVLTTDTEHPDIEDSGDPLTDWRNLGIRYPVALNNANDRAQTGYRIISMCEARDAQITASQRSWNPFD